MLNRIDEFLARWERDNAPGLALAVVQDGKVVLQRDFGLANLDYGIPIDAKTVFRVASLAKQFTAACIGLLEEEGALSLDQDIRTWIPELPEYEGPVTLKQLMWHTGGVHDFPHLLWGLSGRSLGDAVTEQGVLDMLTKIPDTDFRPGTRHLYCNSGYFLLGIVVARVSGQSLAGYAREHIFAPLGMKNTHFQDDYTRIVPNRAVGYAPGEEGFVVFDMPTSTLVGDDGLFTTLEDMLIWEHNFYANRLGRGLLMERMLKRGSLEDGTSVNYGYGLFIDERKGLDLFWHYGENLGFQSVIRSYPQRKLSIICLANTSELVPIDFARELEDILLAEHFASEPAGEARPGVPWPGQVDCRKYVGRYCNRQEGFTIETRMHGSNLQMVINSRNAFDLTWVSQGRAEAAGLDFPLGLEYDEKGKSPRFIDGDNFFPLEPLAAPPHPPTAAEMAELAGEYCSPALGATWLAIAEGDSLRLVNKDRHRLSPADPLVHVFEDFYIAWFSLWRRKVRFIRENGKPVAMVVLNGQPSPTVFLRQ